jgi:peptide/nickel transport system permease protein
MSCKKRNTQSDELVSVKYKKRSQTSEIWHRIKKNKGAVVGLCILARLFLLMIISFFMPFDLVTEGNIRDRFTAPNLQFPFGADNMGRNMFLRVIYGTRYSWIIGFGSVSVALLIGVVAGSVAGYYGGKVDNIILRCSDVLASIPGMLLGMVIVTVMGNSLQNLIIAVGVQCIPAILRITRASMLTVRDNEYIEAAKAIGLSTRAFFSLKHCRTGSAR